MTGEFCGTVLGRLNQRDRLTARCCSEWVHDKFDDRGIIQWKTVEVLAAELGHSKSTIFSEPAKTVS